jgi:superfamily II DNA or RNA helicase
VIVCSRLGQSGAIQRRLHEAGIPTARIDSSLPPDQHTGEAHRFKRGEARVLLMGIKCAQAHSFPGCPNLIVGSLEYSCGTFEQAVGRVWRVNSPREVHVWCVLHQGTIEEVMFDTVATKGDAAAICLRGERVPRDHKAVDLGEVLALNFEALAHIDLKQLPDESATEKDWPALRTQLAKTA